MSWSAVNQYLERRGGSITVHMTIRKIDDATGKIVGQDTISATTGENNPNYKTVLLDQLMQKADLAKIRIDREVETVIDVADMTGDVTTHLNA